MSFYRFAQQLMRRILGFNYKFTILNREKLPMDRGFILASNHTANIDPMVIGLGFNKNVFFMAKEELFKNKFAGFILKKLGAFPVSRGKGDSGAIEKATKIVQGGGVLGIFPEGSRSKEQIIRKAKSGAVLVAAKTRCDIVPVGIVYGKKRIGLRKSLTIIYGDVIKNSELNIGASVDRKELKAASELLMGRIADLVGAEHP